MSGVAQRVPEVNVPRYHDSGTGCGKVVSLTYRPPLLPGSTPGTHFCYSLSRPQDHSAAGRIMSLKNSSDTIGVRTRDLPICISVPQQIAPPPTTDKVIAPIKFVPTQTGLCCDNVNYKVLCSGLCPLVGFFNVKW